MEREAEELQLLGVGGEAFNILLRSSRGKLVRTLSVTLLLPLSLATLAICLMPGPVVFPKFNHYIDYISNPSQEIDYISNHYIDYIIVDDNITTASLTLRAMTSESRGVQQPRRTNIVFVFEFWMLSTAAVLYTAASIYTANRVSLAKAMTVVSMFWKHLVLTLLWFFTIVLAYTTAYILAFFLLIYTVGFNEDVNSREFLFGSVPILAVFFSVLVYINMVGYFASVISVLQEKCYGLVAMRKRNHLIKGKQTTVLALVMLYFILSQGVGLLWYGVFWDAVLPGGVWIGARAVYGTLPVGLLCLVMLWGLLMQSEL